MADDHLHADLHDGKHARVRLQKHNDGEKVDGSWMDRERHDIQTYEYLCHIGEAKEWIEACIKEDIAATTELEEEMRKWNCCRESWQSRSTQRNRTKLQYKHSDNINFLFNAMKAVGLPDVFFFETTDLYEKKNFPKVVYCLTRSKVSALVHVLAKKGLAPSINNLVGKLTFTEDQIEATQQSLEASGVSMPQFGNIENALATAIEEKAEDQESSEDRARREREENEKARQDHFQRNIGKLIQLQSLVRTNQARKLLTELKEADRIKKITKVQAVARARHARKRLESLQEKKAKLDKENRWHELSSKEKLFVKLQARVRGKKERLKYKARLEHYQNNAEAVVKIQALWRAKQMRKAYKNLTSLQNPSTKIIHEFAHLLDESDRDFEDDLDIEDLRQHVVRMIRENVATEAELNELDLKIALLVKNRIGIEDVYHQTLSEGSGSTSTTAYYKKMKNANAGPDQAQRASVVAESDKCAAPFIQKVLDKEARAKLEAYQQLFYLLQTNPNYLAKLMYSLSKRTAGNILKVLEQVTLTLFGYAQNVREEYLLLNLIKTCIKLEVGEIEKLDEFWRANPLFIKLVLQYVRGAKERQFFRDLFQPLIKVVLLDASLNLETDPVFIYKNLIREDELQTGEQSKRSYEASIEQISEDPDVKRKLQDNTTKLQQITDMFLKAIMDSLKSMPFGIRYIAMQLKETMKAKFPGNDTEILKIVGNLIYYRYMNPAIVAPEGFDIIERNLAEVAKTLHQISVCRLAGTENNAALASYITEANKKFMNFFNEASEVVSSEEHFGMDEYIDLSRNQKLSIFITPNEIFQVHDALNSCVEDIIADKNDPMKQVLNELGPAPSPSENTRQEVYLNLVNKFPALEDQDQKTRHLINETKRLVLVVLKVQTGTTLLDILESPVTDKEEQFFQDNTEGDYKKLEERREKKEAQEWRNVVDTSAGPLVSSDQNSTENADSVTSDNTKLTQGSLWKQTVDIGGSRNKVSRKKTAECVRLENESHDENENQLGSGSLFFGSGSLFCLKADPSVAITFNSVKKRALENMAKLEETGTVNKKNGYQDMLNMIAHDMLNRHKRKNQRKHEGQALKKTLSSLEDKAIYLSEQKKSYHDYINSCMAQHKKTLKVKKGPFPFTRQYFHLKELQKSGNVPQFGSYKFTALDLYKRGVLISMNDHSPKQYGQITLTISSSESGIFTIEASILGVKLSDAMELRLEDLLQSQYDGIQTMVLFDVAKVNVNLLTYLLNKKFYV
ncbi:hypothetical protein BDR26DRAFT_855067 [Obelidium mucronatum]|nr:hypothetical protein BDR26DRAFT_855067 [Obelidium mucronatum]